MAQELAPRSMLQNVKAYIENVICGVPISINPDAAQEVNYFDEDVLSKARPRKLIPKDAKSNVQWISYAFKKQWKKKEPLEWVAIAKYDDEREPIWVCPFAMMRIFPFYCKELMCVATESNNEFAQLFVCMDVANATYGDYEDINIEHMITDYLHSANNLCKYDRYVTLSAVISTFKQVTDKLFKYITEVFKQYHLYKLYFVLSKNITKTIALYTRIAGDKVELYYLVISSVLTELLCIGKKLKMNLFSLRLIKQMNYYHSKYLNFVKHTPFGTVGFKKEAFILGRYCRKVLEILYKTRKQFKPTHYRVFVEMICNINTFENQEHFSELCFVDCSNQGFERNMIYVQNIIKKHLQSLDHEDTPEKLLSLFHFISANKTIVENVLRIAQNITDEQEREKLIFEEIENAFHENAGRDSEYEDSDSESDGDSDSHSDEDTNDSDSELVEPPESILSNEVIGRADIAIGNTSKSKRKGNFDWNIVTEGGGCRDCYGTIKDKEIYCLDCEDRKAREQIKLINYLYEYNNDKFSKTYDRKRKKIVKLLMDSTETCPIEIDNDQLFGYRVSNIDDSGHNDNAE